MRLESLEHIHELRKSFNEQFEVLEKLAEGKDFTYTSLDVSTSVTLTAVLTEGNGITKGQVKKYQWHNTVFSK
tara:strand:- start:6130 stop:6348 length:219 start_codon:yes stop_codon:yes gene_type:complete